MFILLVESEFHQIDVAQVKMRGEMISIPDLSQINVTLLRK